MTDTISKTLHHIQTYSFSSREFSQHSARLFAVLPHLLFMMNSKDQCRITITDMYSVVFRVLGVNLSDLKRQEPLRLIIEVAFVFLFAIRPEAESLKTTFVMRDVDELLRKYPEFNRVDSVELSILLSFRNFMKLAMVTIRAEHHKNQLLDICARIVEGHGVRYITGGGQKPATDRRVLIYERESGVVLKQRIPARGGPAEKLKKAALLAACAIQRKEMFSNRGSVGRASSLSAVRQSTSSPRVASSCFGVVPSSHPSPRSPSSPGTPPSHDLENSCLFDFEDCAPSSEGESYGDCGDDEEDEIGSGNSECVDGGKQLMTLATPNSSLANPGSVVGSLCVVSNAVPDPPPPAPVSPPNSRLLERRPSVGDVDEFLAPFLALRALEPGEGGGSEGAKAQQYSPFYFNQSPHPHHPHTFAGDCQGPAGTATLGSSNSFGGGGGVGFSPRGWGGARGPAEAGSDAVSDAAWATGLLAVLGS